VIYLAGLTAFPRDVREAARIDGASSFQVLRYVIFPLLTPTTFFLLVVATIGAFQSFSLIYVLTTNGSSDIGSPLGTTLVATLYVFERFYQDMQLGYAAALALLVALIVLLITVVQFAVLERRVYYETER
jgi:ABC-type sugar transport system permease subunit